MMEENFNSSIIYLFLVQVQGRFAEVKHKIDETSSYVSNICLCHFNSSGSYTNSTYHVRFIKSEMSKNKYRNTFIASIFFSSSMR